ncbi:alpha/beta fold hydrolase [Haliscomenobacter hydrossis]|uniref:Alpha/beta hydrolase fold protein n=1 Tax=Haliscomenobacter hydrossis (strain ATCC 27775 / DSM 1100 / LMG 10767 / O) TaxID=760192 RepID=F4L5E1_HALH1|nr:alpha/beta fold hydrolase [Haliscomenobacter hydrossis]AEE50805.1 alpha/beta hydrolase fold protein [Haliscomenobacter hydrossis DSM 1100]
MQKNVLQLSGGQLHYHQYGTGSRLWIAFHGFAREGRSFASLAHFLPENTCLIALDLPWHGSSEWRETSFSLADIAQGIDQLLRLKQQTHYTALGFSFGARLCLALAKAEAQRWERLILLAPDGLPRGGWYQFVDQAPLGFKKQVVRLFAHAQVLLRLASTLYNWKLLDGLSYRFLRLHLQSESSCKRLAGIWISAAAFPALRKSCQQVAATPHLPVQLVTGNEDSVIPQTAFAHLAQLIPQLQWTKLARADHDLLSAAVLTQWGNIIQES